MVTKPLGVLYGRGTQTLRLGGEWNESTPSFHRHGYVLNSLVTSMPFLTEVWLEEATFDPAVLSCAQGEPQFVVSVVLSHADFRRSPQISRSCTSATLNSSTPTRKTASTGVYLACTLSTWPTPP